MKSLCQKWNSGLLHVTHMMKKWSPSACFSDRSWGQPGWGFPNKTCGEGGHTEVDRYVPGLDDAFVRVLASAQTPHPEGAERRETEEERDRVSAKFLLPQISYHFSPPEKSPGWRACSYRCRRCTVEENMNRLWTSEMPAEMFRCAGLHNECGFSANCLDTELTGFTAIVHSDPGFLLLPETQHLQRLQLCVCTALVVMCIWPCCWRVFYL